MMEDIHVGPRDATTSPCFTLFGYAAWATMGGALVDHVSYVAAFIVAGIMSLPATISVLFLIPKW